MISCDILRIGSAVVCLALPVAACAPSGRDVDSTSASAGVKTTKTIDSPIASPVSALDTGRSLAPAEKPALDPDQRFLRQLLDEHERLAAIVHERMMMRHDDHEMAPGMSMDPARNTSGLDSDFDAERTAIADVLRRVYGDSHTPVLAPRGLRTADSLARNAPVSGDSAYRAQLLGGLRRQQTFVTRQSPNLHRSEVRRLAMMISKAAKDREKMLTAAH